ncbi:hypothetical protein QWZ10_06735 [Paracoccus cavernae]|uniref:Uncharacterized protein n=1 Tax=Paracoccus cavernae TaxID=1571207 RepID=A0ABT8D851_9RHOB|nr:hypothetical protein [Paracoccus cavernae]
MTPTSSMPFSEKLSAALSFLFSDAGQLRFLLATALVLMLAFAVMWRRAAADRRAAGHRLEALGAQIRQHETAAISAAEGAKALEQRLAEVGAHEREVSLRLGRIESAYDGQAGRLREVIEERDDLRDALHAARQSEGCFNANWPKPFLPPTRTARRRRAT